MPLLDSVKVTTALDYASGTADRTGAAVDMLNFDGLLVVLHLAAVATGGTNSAKIQQAVASAFTTPHDLEGSAITIADDDDNQILVWDVEQPIERFVRLYVDKDTANACAESAIYIQYKADYKPTVNDVTDAVTTKYLMRAATGTA